MAQTQFFMTMDDNLALTKFLIELVSAEFVPERSVDPPPFPRYSTPTEVQARIEADIHHSRYSRFFVLSALWERFPLLFTETHANDGQHFFSVSQQYGGPAFDFIPGRSYELDGDRWMVAGDFSDYSYYIQDKEFFHDHSLYKTFDRPLAMESTHNAVRKYLRQIGCRSICTETGHSGPWIAMGALKEYEAGMWLRAGDWHFAPKPPS